MNISLKEASECEYWIELLTNTEYLPQDSAQSLLEDCQEFNKNPNLNRKVSEREITMIYEL